MASAIVSGGADGPKGCPYVREWRLLVCGCWFLDDGRSTIDDSCRKMAPAINPSTRPLPGRGGGQGEGGRRRVGRWQRDGGRWVRGNGGGEWSARGGRRGG